MGRMTPTGRSKSWNVGSYPAEMRQNSPYKKFKLLLWKNWKIQTRHYVQTVTEILLPLLFTIFLVVIRHITPSTHISEATVYKSFLVNDIPPIAVRTKCNEIYYTPKNPVVDELMDKLRMDYFNNRYVIDSTNYTFTGFDSEEKMIEAFQNSAGDKVEENLLTLEFETSEPVLAGIVFTNRFPKGKFPSNITYKLRFPANQRSEFDLITERFGLQANWYTELIYPLFLLLGPRSSEKNHAGLPGYYEEGFLYLQYALDSTLTNQLLNGTGAENYNYHNIQLHRYPYPPYIDDKFIFALQGWLPLITLLSFIYPIINITKAVIYEKENRLKESMKMMGLPNYLHWAAWYVKSLMFLGFSVVIMTLLMKAKFSDDQALAILAKTDGYVLFVILMAFTLSVISFSFFISTLFSNANSGATAAGFLFFILYVPYGFLQPRYNFLSLEFKIGSCFFTNLAIAFACQILVQFEGTGAGLQWETMLQASTPDDDFSMVHCIIMMCVNAIVYFLSAIYIEAVWPGDYGVPLPWNFFLTKWYWTGKAGERTTRKMIRERKDGRESYFEAEPKGLTPGIQIVQLTKHFGEKTAVNNMDLTLYENQITALLGHNGAGKTTTMSMLTGLFPPSAGTAILNGYDICKDIDSVRSSLGICPQHNVLFDELTVEEHLRFFCLMKSLPDFAVQAEIDRMLKSLGLEDKRHAQSHTLSGGMKRKLSVGIALCGGSKIVLLDEPTSGMDPGARRSTWDLIQTEKKERTILLSTHFMEEADLLGDRIAIMAEGDVQCTGSSLFLKKKYGGGYHLTIVKHPECEVDKITQLLKETLPDVEIDQNIGAELSYSLPDEKSKLFPDMFQELEKRKIELGIASYGASITTMEEVFIRVGREADKKFAAEASLANKAYQVSMDHSSPNDSRTGLYQEDTYRNTGLTLLFQQFKAMIIKKFIYAIRNKLLLICQMCIPIVYLAIVLLVLSTLPGLSDPPPHTITLDRYERLAKARTPINCFNDSEICQSYKRFVGENYITEDVSNGTMDTYLINKGVEDLVRVNFKYIVGFEERLLQVNETTMPGGNNNYTMVGYFNNQPFHALPLTLNYMTNAILQSKSDYTVTITNHPFPFGGFETVQLTGSVYTVGFQVGYNISLGMAFLAASFVVFLISERETKSKHLQFVSGIKFPLFWLASFVVDMINYVIPCFFLLLALFCFKTDEFSGFYMNIYLFVLLLMYGWAIIPFMYLWSFAFTIPTSGLTRMAIFNIFTGLATMFTVVLLQIPELGLGAVADMLNNIFLIFPNYALGMGIVYLSSNFQLKKQCATFELEFLCLAWEDNFCCEKLKDNYLDWNPNGIGRNLVYLAVTGFLSFVILFIAEASGEIKGFFKSKKGEAWIDEEPKEGENALEDNDVKAENERIRTHSLDQIFPTDNLILKDLSKSYNKLLAVDRLCLGVKKGETFGLLGVNGAGKTTTFKMLTGDIPCSSGDAYIDSKSITYAIKEIHKNLGYCPQFDALIDQMTGRETIRMYARLRGISEFQIDSLVDKLATNLLFSNHIDKLVGAYSGGNKRKLSTALALVGNPPIVFLDEPTTGMDPVARRHLWSAISMVREAGTSIVLTSHSMEECEALCSRLAIMVNGKFRCLGSPQHLKSKFGEGYTLIAQIPIKGWDDEPVTRAKQEAGRRRSSMKISKQHAVLMKWEVELEDLRNFIEESFPGCILKDIHPGFVHYHVVNPEVTWGQMFATMEIAKERFNLDAYSVGQTSLEQVFLNFTKAQIDFEK